MGETGGDLRNPFTHFAKEKSSFSRRAFGKGLRKLEMDLDLRVEDDLFDLIDANKNGSVKFSEFSMFVHGSRYTDAEDKLRWLISKSASSWDGGKSLRRA